MGLFFNTEIKKHLLFLKTLRLMLRRKQTRLLEPYILIEDESLLEPIFVM